MPCRLQICRSGDSTFQMSEFKILQLKNILSLIQNSFEMKKLNLKALDLQGSEVLTREQLKKVLGGRLCLQ